MHCVASKARKEKFSGPGKNSKRNVTDLAGSLVTSSRLLGRLQKRSDDQTAGVAVLTLASTPPGMPGTHPSQYFGWGDVNGNIPPILLRTFGYSRPLLVALRSLSLNPISFGYKTPPIRFSQAGGQSAHEARPPPQP